MHTQTIGFGLIGVGIWLLFISGESNYSVITGSSIISVTTLVVVAGVFTVIICTLGILGACAEWKGILILV